jgi:hypothetical protein
MSLQGFIKGGAVPVEEVSMRRAVACAFLAICAVERLRTE